MQSGRTYGSYQDTLPFLEANAGADAETSLSSSHGVLRALLPLDMASEPGGTLGVSISTEGGFGEG